jgi:hypothetical protein
MKEMKTRIIPRIPAVFRLSIIRMAVFVFMKFMAGNGESFPLYRKSVIRMVGKLDKVE